MWNKVSQNGTGNVMARWKLQQLFLERFYDMRQVERNM